MLDSISPNIKGKSFDSLRIFYLCYFIYLLIYLFVYLFIFVVKEANKIENVKIHRVHSLELRLLLAYSSFRVFPFRCYKAFKQ